jgi:hypothetical protein
MASTPLYKSLKPNGTSFYAFPGAVEDISAAYQNSTYKMYFSKYVLVNFPKQNLVSGTMSKPTYFDFDNQFERSNVATPATNFNDAIIESLRNYVANHEVVLRESKLNNTQYYYDTNALETTTEKIFFKWCKKLKIIDFEPAIPEDEYFSQLNEFRSFAPNDDAYFPEFLWKEREVISFDVLEFYETASLANPNKLECLFPGTTNFRVGDTVNFFGIEDVTILGFFGPAGYDPVNGLNVKVLEITPATATTGQKIVFDITFFPSVGVGLDAVFGYAELVYHRLIQYIGEVNGVSNVQEANRAYTEVYAHIPDHTGRTPDILFRTMTDVNYKANMTFPILPSQYQPEILGAELFSSPIVSNPQNYPGSYYGQFDTPDYTYETASGDAIRRSGDYFGVTGDINNPVTNGQTIDGIGIDFNTNHYVKMNIPRRRLTNFDQFNAQSTNNEPPRDFEFNAILWYYTVDNGNGNIRTNLYGVSFLDNPNNNVIEEEVGLRFPVYKKLVTNGQQDGTSYAFNLNLNFNIINDNVTEAYNPEAVNSMFSMNLFNQAMRSLASANDSFLQVISENVTIREELTNLRSLLYTQTDINTINGRINNLELLLRLYSNLQIVNSESVVAVLAPGNPPTLSLETIDSFYRGVYNYFTSNMYSFTGNIPLSINIPQNRTVLVNLVNNDEISAVLPNNQKLVLNIDRDLTLGQVVEINITPSVNSTQNKKLDIFINSSYTGVQTPVLLVGDINLPVSFNPISTLPNPSYSWKEFQFKIDLNSNMTLLSNNKLLLSFEESPTLINNSIKVGDVYDLNNFFVGTSSIYDFSGQYTVDTLISPTSSQVQFDLSSNPLVVSYGASASLPLTINSSTQSILSNLPYFALNKGKKIKIVCVSESTNLNERYHIEMNDIM